MNIIESNNYKKSCKKILKNKKRELERLDAIITLFITYNINNTI